MKISMTTAMVCVLSALTGCAMSHRDAANRGEGSVSTELVESAWLAGQMQTVGAFDGDAYQIDAWGGSITVHTGSLGGEFSGWAMFQLSTSDPDGFDAEIFEPGSTLRLGEDDIDAIGCSGPAHGNYTFDGPATELELQVDEGPTPGSRLFRFFARYPDGQHVEGAFVYNPR